MRTEKEMFNLILNIAREDERIRAVYMNGSRTNSHAPKDIFQDYDIVYVVTETASFIQDEAWVHVFGHLLMMQEPDKNNRSVGAEMDFDRSYGYLMLFTDGNRIDLHIETLDSMLEQYSSDSLTIPLLDKDGCLPPIPDATDTDYHVKKPSEALFMSCCNNFWWCLQNVAKGIWRDELPYAKQMFEQVIRATLDEMVSWWIGSKHDFGVSAGKMGKYFKIYLPEEYWNMYKKTYAEASYEKMWSSVWVTCDLFRVLAHEVADHLGYIYPVQDDVNMSSYLKHVSQLPADARKIYES
ncbi:aminoglycoside 6-adenylyltransferase [Paenibacillus sp. KQZ6P-2]|uniref:Aminoglycoside 6-adenylyltransferase n=1 Tax=Paenibacillus mangrovi TaxID=2931978 RepID=A0A9X1WKZ1_9BACL|nr:aminoglycoside 6-adenylyltransferase [Paenibacillus mangrovi]MCJ8010809.1 aminoglycoside 6-adenylyltransferase [Paenibacillus mangrovi]